MSYDQSKWSCDYCTYENYPNAIKCTMCRGPRTRLSEDIYKLSSDNPSIGASSGLNKKADSCSSKWACEVCTFINQSRCRECSQCRTARPAIIASNLHEQLKPLKISDSSENVNSPPPSKPFKWSCSACTYENWPKAKKCIMCGTVITNHISPTHSNMSTKVASPERDINQPRTNYEENNSSSLKRFVSFFFHFRVFYHSYNFLSQFIDYTSSNTKSLMNFVLKTTLFIL